MSITSVNIQDGTYSERRCRPEFKRRIIVIFIAVLVVVVFVLIYHTATRNLPPNNPENPLPPSKSLLRKFQKGAVCSDSAVCSDIGTDILKRNGSAVDATIATMFCNGLVTMQSMGIGGGFFMTIYTKSDKKAVALNAREAAPLKATSTMFADDQSKSRVGPLAIAVPGELKGYRAAHEKFGVLKWKELVIPTIELCKHGFNISQHQYNSLKYRKEVKNDTLLKELFVQEDGSFKPVGSLIKHESYCKTLEMIAEDSDSLYTGKLADSLIADIEEVGGIITKEDLKKYEAKWDKAVTVSLGDDTLYSVPLPGSGNLLGFILNVLKGYNFSKGDVDGLNNTVLTYHRIIETFKYAYAERTRLGDPTYNNLTDLIANLSSIEFANIVRSKIFDNKTFNDPAHYGALYANKDDHGTSHISVLAPNGDAVSVTSTVNLYFGAAVMSKRTGIILNSGMDDFSVQAFENYFGLPFSPTNSISPEKRALSSMNPTIITDKNGDVRLVIGAAGGTKITSAVALVIMRSLWFEENIKIAVDAPRFHHQLFPMEVNYEYGIPQGIVTGLEALGHNGSRYSGPGSVICAITRENGAVYGNADFRKGGDVLGVD